MNADTHPDNAQHQYSPGCFRCHDGKHITEKTEAIRLECNLCHSIPIVTGPDEFVTNIELSNGPEPELHRNTNWIMVHQNSIDGTCSTCHTMDDPGGVSNTSFCSNSACHGAKWTYAGFDAPKIRSILNETIQPTPAPTEKPAAPPKETDDEPTPVVEESGSSSGTITYEGNIAAIMQKCTSCHGDNGMKGVILKNYTTIMAGSPEGPLVVPGDSNASLVIKVLTGSEPHFAQLTQEELKTLTEWIDAGAPEK